MEHISKVELAGPADGLGEGGWQVPCNHNPDPLPSLHPSPLACNFDISSASVPGLDHVPGFCK